MPLLIIAVICFFFFPTVFVFILWAMAFVAIAWVAIMLWPITIMIVLIAILTGVLPL